MSDMFNRKSECHDAFHMDEVRFGKFYLVGMHLVVLELLNECGMYAYRASDGVHVIYCKRASACKRLMHWPWCCRS